jgi:hypothetical protein
MPISPATMGTTPYVITHTPVNRLNANGAHWAHDPADRKTEAYAGLGANLTRVTFANNAALGQTYYLPFSGNNIHSMMLPANPGFPALFTTANLDGCWIWVERKTNGQVIVYHANSSGPGNSPTALQSATTPLFQTPAAQNNLTALYNAARGYYGGVTQLNWCLNKPRYLREVNNRLLHKAAMGRTGINFASPEHGSYTTFAGFYLNGHWEFWFQTFSQFLYRRPTMHAKSVFGHRNVNPHVANSPYEVVESVRWLVVP